MFDLCALSRDFTLTEIITSAFKTAVTGKLMMLNMMRKIRKATPQEDGCCSLLPNTRSASQPGGLVVELKFMASCLTISDFLLLNELVLGLKKIWAENCSALSRDHHQRVQNCGDWKGDDVKDNEEDQKSYAREGRVM